MSSPNSDPAYNNNPLPYPDRRRPGHSQQQQPYENMGQAESTTSGPPPAAGGGGLPYPNRPARYQDYSKTPLSSHPPPRSNAESYQPPPPQQHEAKPVVAAPQSPSGTWPRPPTEYNGPVESKPAYTSTAQSKYGTNTSSPTQAGYASSNPFVMSDVATSLPPANASPTQSSSYPSQHSYQDSTYPTSSPPPVPGKVPLPPSPSAAPITPQYQQPAPSTAQPYDRRQSGYSNVAPVAAGVAAATAYQYANTQSPPAQQPAAQPPVSNLAPTNPAYGQQTTPYNVAPTQQYGAQSPVLPAQQAPPSPVPAATTPGYTQPLSTSYNAPQGPQYAGQGPTATPAGYQQTPPSPGQPGSGSPTQVPTQPYVPQPTATSPPIKSEYMSAPPPIPGTAPAPASAFPPPPQTYKPGQQATQGAAPSYPGQPGTVRIDGKDYPIPAFTHTIQTPTQCESALKEAYFGPYLRFKNVDLQRNLWLGSVLLVLPTQLPPPQLEFHPSGDFSRLQAAPFQQIYTYDNYSFVRYDLVIPIGPVEQKWTYAITTQGTQTWEFVVAGQQQRWRFIAWSCNDFSASVKQEERDKLGFGTVWKNVNERHAQEGGFHAQLGGGDQIYADRMWKEIPFLIEWLAVKGKEQRQHTPWKPEHEEIMRHTYLYYYTSSFAKPQLRDALAKIPNVFQIDDHDIFDGFGSYPHHLQQSNVFQAIGKIAIEFYLIFQHHTTQQLLLQNPDTNDLVTATGTGYSFIKYFGPTTAIFGLDTRSERDKYRIMSQQSYDLMFNRLRQVPPTVVYCVVMLAVPIVYPRLETVERALTGVAVAKKGVNGAFNLLGKAVTTVTPAGSATQTTHSAFDGVKKAFGKSGLMSSVVSKFGEVDLLDDLMDHWTHGSHDRERTMVIRTFQEIALQRRIRMTFVSGDVHCCGVGYLYDPKSPQDHKLMFQIITSAIVNVPPPGMVIKLLHNGDKYYVPPMNSPQSTKVASDTKEEMMELFAKDVDGKALGNLKKLLPRRNYAICKADEQGNEVWEICVERGRGSDTVKYGPIVIPRLQ